MMTRYQSLAEHLFYDDRSVSPVVATILMVAVVVVIAASLGAVAFGFTDELGGTDIAASDDQCLQSVEFDPADIDSFADSATADLNCQLWFDATQQGASDGDPVDELIDRSGNEFNAQVVVSGPEIDTVDGVQAVRFGGADDEGFSTDATVDDLNLDGDSEFTVATVVRADPDSTGAVVQFGEIVDGDETPFSFQPNLESFDEWQIQALNNEAGQDFVSYLDEPSDQQAERWFVQTHVYDGSRLSINVDGEEKLNEEIDYEFTNSPINIGYYNYGPNPEDAFEGSIAEVVIINEAFTDTDREVLECTIDEKHGSAVSVNGC